MFMQIQNGIEEVTELHHLYVHIPFCPKVCPYCSFYKEASDRNKTQAFLDSVLLDLDRGSRKGRSAGLKRSFLGAAPRPPFQSSNWSFFSPACIDRLDLTGLREWTLEMNPATVSLEKAQMLHDFGVNRISMGVQSWDPEMLDRLGRVHSAQQAERSFGILREAGFTNLNLDLMFGIPGQSIETWEQSLRKTIRLAPDHISAYCLTFEEDTEFFRRHQRGELPQDTEQEARIFERTMEILETGGYQQYEISNYANPGFECRHNLAYWLGRDYLGLGPSAFSTIGERRWQNTPDTTRYIEQLRAGIEPIHFKEIITGQIRTAEAIAFGLRTSVGVLESSMAGWSGELAALRTAGYLEKTNAHVRLTAKGRMVADSIAELFV